MTLPQCIVKECGKPAGFRLSDIPAALGSPMVPPYDGPLCADHYDSIVNMLRHAESPAEEE